MHRFLGHGVSWRQAGVRLASERSIILYHPRYVSRYFDATPLNGTIQFFKLLVDLPRFSGEGGNHPLTKAAMSSTTGM